MDEALVHVAREGLYLILLCSAPPVGAVIAAALVVAVLQATTQVQEQTLSFTPKLIAASAALVVAGPWIAAQLVRFTTAVFDVIPWVARGG